MLAASVHLWLIGSLIGGLQVALVCMRFQYPCRMYWLYQYLAGWCCLCWYLFPVCYRDAIMQLCVTLICYSFRQILGPPVLVVAVLWLDLLDVPREQCAFHHGLPCGVNPGAATTCPSAARVPGTACSPAGPGTCWGGTVHACVCACVLAFA